MPTCDEIRTAIHKYNAENFLEDDALKSALSSTRTASRSFGAHLAEVCLVADWGSLNLNHFPFQARIAMAREIETCEAVLEPIRGWHLKKLDAAETKMLSDVVEQQLSQTNLLQPPNTNKRQLSFLSKSLHWQVNDAFPIWDGNARHALDCHNDDRSWNSYISWLSCVRTEAARHQSCCLEAARLNGESLLRTLDKALYMLGRRKS